MDKSIGNSNLDPIDFDPSLSGVGDITESEDLDIISLLAVESLSMGAKTSNNKDLTQSQVKIGDLGDAEDIERLMQECLSDIEIIEDEQLVDLSDISLLDIVDGELEIEIPVLEFSDEFYDEVIFSDSAESESINSVEAIDKALKELSREFVIEEEPQNDRAVFKLLHEVVDPKKILVTYSSPMSGETTKAKKEIFEKYKNEGKLVYDEGVDTDIIEAFSKNEIEFTIFSEYEWEKHIELVYLATLGVRISNIRDFSFNQKDTLEKEATEQNISLPKIHRFQSSEILSENIVTHNFKKTILPKILLSGLVLASVRKIERSLLEKREDQKEEVRQENLKKVVDQYILSKIVQRDLMNWNIKKEKIWYENATSFLRFLLKRDRKFSLFKL